MILGSARPVRMCAAAFLPYYEGCAAELQGHAAELPLSQFASCQELDSGAGLMLQPVAVQMLRVLVNTEGTAQSGSMFPGGGASAGGTGSSLHCSQLTPVPPPPDATAGSGDATGESRSTTPSAPPRTSRAATCRPATWTHHG